MTDFIQGEPRHQSTLFPEAFDDYIHDNNPVRVIHAPMSEAYDLMYLLAKFYPL